MTIAFCGLLINSLFADSFSTENSFRYKTIYREKGNTLKNTDKVKRVEEGRVVKVLKAEKKSMKMKSAASRYKPKLKDVSTRSSQ